jgi:hypothetical protein
MYKDDLEMMHAHFTLYGGLNSSHKHFYLRYDYQISTKKVNYTQVLKVKGLTSPNKFLVSELLKSNT